MLICRLSAGHYEKMRDGAVVLESDSKGEKVLQLRDGTMIKWFKKPGKLFSFAHFYPYALRFVRHANKLENLGIRTVRPIRVYRSADNFLSVVYRPLQGETVRSALKKTHNVYRQINLIAELGSFVALLHQLGIYFRSLHLGNVIVQHSGSFGLIDVADMKFFRTPLSNRRRLRNFRHQARYQEDLLLMNPMRKSFLMHYIAGTQNGMPEEEIDGILWQNKNFRNNHTC